LEGRTVLARTDSFGYRASKFLRRNRVTVAVALATAFGFAALLLAFRLLAPQRLPRVSGVTQRTQSGHIAGYGLATDGSYVYCVQRSPGKNTLSRVPVSGGAPQPLHSEFDFPEILDISPDRSSLLLSNGVGLDVPLWIVPTDGGQAHRVGDALGHVATWAPDGKSLVFARENSLFGTGRDGSGTRKLLDADGNAVDIHWSPVRGEDVLRFSIKPYGKPGDSIWEARPDGTHVHPMFPGHKTISGSPIAEDSGRWLADGKYFVFRSVREGVYSLVAVRENGRAWCCPARIRFLFTPPHRGFIIQPRPPTTSGFSSLAVSSAANLSALTAREGSLCPIAPVWQDDGQHSLRTAAGWPTPLLLRKLSGAAGQTGVMPGRLRCLG
jgi:hypothetical protein